MAQNSKKKMKIKRRRFSHNGDFPEVKIAEGITPDDRKNYGVAVPECIKNGTNSPVEELSIEELPNKETLYSFYSYQMDIFRQISNGEYRILK